MIRENRLFLGNPGAGKSTLINCLVGASKLKSGLSWGGGLTQDYQRVDHDGVAYMDTPGLADTAIAEQAAKAITTALKQGGQYKLFFMMRLQNGRVVSEDLVTLERVLSAIDMAASKIRFSVIFNNVDKKQYNPLTQPDSEAFKSVHSVVNGRQFKTDAFCFIPGITELDEASDAVVTLPQHVRDFMDETAPSMRIKPSVVRAVDPTGFAQQARLIQEEMEKLLNSRATMMAAIAAQQQQNDAAMQREREAHAAQLQSMQRTPGEALSPRYDGDYYAAHPQTPPIGPAVGEPENKSLMNRKKLLVGAGVVAGAAVLITIIIVAVTSGGDTTQPSQPPSQPDLSSTATDTVVPVAKWELLGCDDRDVPRNHVSINWQANIALAAELASQNSKPYFAVSADNTIAVAFSDLKPGRPKQSGQICDASVPGRSSWTIYKVITESKEPSQPQPSIPTSTETPTTKPTTTPVHTPAQTPTVTPMVTPTVTPAQMPTN